MSSAQEPPTAAIAFDSVSKSYGGGGRKVLEELSLAVGEREFLAVVGPSGSGKTTLLRLINRLIDPQEFTMIEPASRSLAEAAVEYAGFFGLAGLLAPA